MPGLLATDALASIVPRGTVRAPSLTAARIGIVAAALRAAGPLEYEPGSA
jgi:hypothetical protein